MLCQSAVADRPDGEPWYTDTRPELRLPYKASPIAISEKPSPFTSPADDTDKPKSLPAASASAIQSASSESPIGEPWKTYAWPPLKPWGAPITTSE